MIAVIDYKAGNSPSVLNALRKLGIPCKLTSTKKELASASGIILPGVGAADATMDSLKGLDIIDTLEKKVLEDKTPFFGICVGLQVLFEYSEEGGTNCLGWIKGCVKKFDEKQMKVPQIGWNEVYFRDEERYITKGLTKSEYFYFVNSYHAVPDNPDDILATTEYGINFCSMVEAGNIYATQFHVEKSGVVGLQLLKNFSDIIMGVNHGGMVC